MWEITTFEGEGTVGIRGVTPHGLGHILVGIEHIWVIFYLAIFLGKLVWMHGASVEM